MISPPLRRRTSIALITVSAVAAFLYANFIIDWVLRGFSGMGEIVSELEAPGEPNAVLLRVTDVVCAVLVVSLLPWVRGGLRSGSGARSSSGRPSSSRSVRPAPRSWPPRAGRAWRATTPTSSCS